MGKKTAPLVRPSRKAASDQPAVAPCLGDEPHHGQSVLEEGIRLRAYEKWEAAGKPQGDGIRFWFEAEEELKALLSPALQGMSPRK